MDWWDEISAEERAEIEEGLAQADRGEVVSQAALVQDSVRDRPTDQ